MARRRDTNSNVELGSRITINVVILAIQDVDEVSPKAFCVDAFAGLECKTPVPRLQEIGKSTMIDEPCGVLNTNSGCIVDGVCTNH
ncbi:hypothetical protein TNIN_67311 [Trichonephila inaurata madagascariensis]|uniref:Uncharacterized protein n=1 Tax=Trichonephila inaurata madagascariensis TaxID=2747483 RepID=A0A8X6MAV4_9ARAC|nr:hypothetical protein TNIN_67311 [Trichonephila inaurata madagascariensis]